MKLVFIYSKWCSSMHGPFDMDHLYTSKGLTGSESDFFNMAIELSSMGHDVTIVCDTKLSGKNEKLDGVMIRSIAEFPQHTFGDRETVFLTWNDPRPLEFVPKENLRIHKHEINDFFFCLEDGKDPSAIEKLADYWIFLSSKQLEYNLAITSTPKIPKNKCHVGWNSTNLEFFTCQVKRDPNKIIYCSSPDRGLHHLLEFFPKIRQKNPDAHLDVFYELKRWIAWVKTWPESNGLRKRGELIERQLASLEGNGVNLRGFVSNREMARELCSANVFAYPCDTVSFTEGFSIATLDACAAGCIPIISDADSLGEIHGDASIMIPGKVSEQKECWIDTISGFLGSETENSRKIQEKARLHALKFSRQTMAGRLERFIRKAFIEKHGRWPLADSSPLSFDLSAKNSAFSMTQDIHDHTPQLGDVRMKTRIAMIYGKFCSQIHGHFDPKGFGETQGLTGSESFFFNTVWGLSELGYQVDAFCDVPKIYRSPELAGAHIYPLSTPMGNDYDAYMTWNEPDLLREVKTRDPKKITICAQQLNDFDSYTKPEFEKLIDMFVFPSETHQKYMLGITKIKPDQSCVIPNSVNLEFFEPTTGRIKRNPRSIVWASSPDRGLHVLLEMFPKIRKKVPDAILKIFYRFDPWYQGVKDAMTPNGQRARYINECLNRLGKYGENGVFLIGQISNREMARELLASKVLAYTCEPFRFTEGFSVTIMDACAGGCIPIISDADAIGEVYKNSGAVIIPGKPSEHKDQWIMIIANMLMLDDASTETNPTGASPTGASPTGASPTGASPTGASPTGASPTGASPTGASLMRDRCKKFAQKFSRQEAAKAWEKLYKMLEQKNG